ncbi:hypothetical protein ACFY20_08850 [Streptomyces sp. NPDC001312]|uniref:hypothetical protein n=1 Tax=Streptomyces sp. NPDC001312 TaxID=3364561 RepID=UPI0036B510F9
MNVEDVIRARIEAARQKAEREKRQREELAAARTAGLAHRHAQRLRNQASRRPTEETPMPSAVRSTLCPACRAQRPVRVVATVIVVGAPHDVVRCSADACELLWCVRADRPRVAAD